MPAEGEEGIDNDIRRGRLNTRRIPKSFGIHRGVGLGRGELGSCPQGLCDIESGVSQSRKIVVLGVIRHRTIRGNLCRQRYILRLNMFFYWSFG